MKKLQKTFYDNIIRLSQASALQAVNKIDESIYALGGLRNKNKNKYTLTGDTVDTAPVAEPTSEQPVAETVAPPIPETSEQTQSPEAAPPVPETQTEEKVEDKEPEKAPDIPGMTSPLPPEKDKSTKPKAEPAEKKPMGVPREEAPKASDFQKANFKLRNQIGQSNISKKDITDFIQILANFFSSELNQRGRTNKGISNVTSDESLNDISRFVDEHKTYIADVENAKDVIEAAKILQSAWKQLNRASAKRPKKVTEPSKNNPSDKMEPKEDDFLRTIITRLHNGTLAAEKNIHQGRTLLALYNKLKVILDGNISAINEQGEIVSEVGKQNPTITPDVYKADLAVAFMNKIVKLTSKNSDGNIRQIEPEKIRIDIHEFDELIVSLTGELELGLSKKDAFETFVVWYNKSKDEIKEFLAALLQQNISLPDGTKINYKDRAQTTSGLMELIEPFMASIESCSKLYERSAELFGYSEVTKGSWYNVFLGRYVTAVIVIVANSNMQSDIKDAEIFEFITKKYHDYNEAEIKSFKRTLRRSGDLVGENKFVKILAKCKELVNQYNALTDDNQKEIWKKKFGFENIENLFSMVNILSTKKPSKKTDSTEPKKVREPKPDKDAPPIPDTSEQTAPPIPDTDTKAPPIPSTETEAPPIPKTPTDEPIKQPEVSDKPKAAPPIPETTPEAKKRRVQRTIDVPGFFEALEKGIHDGTLGTDEKGNVIEGKIVQDVAEEIKEFTTSIAAMLYEDDMDEDEKDDILHQTIEHIRDEYLVGADASDAIIEGFNLAQKSILKDLREKALIRRKALIAERLKKSTQDSK